MGRGNRKKAIVALHKEQIMTAAENLFSEKGFAQTTIDDISKTSEYSRRTIYSYYESKEDILHHIIEKGLMLLKQDIENAVNTSDNFIVGYKEICFAMSKYQKECPHSLYGVNNASTSNIDISSASEAVKHILSLGSEINYILAEFIKAGKVNGVVRQDIEPVLTVYILWSSLTSLLTLANTKGEFICKQFSISEKEFLEYGFKQLINSILEVRI